MIGFKYLISTVGFQYLISTGRFQYRISTGEFKYRIRTGHRTSWGETGICSVTHKLYLYKRRRALIKIVSQIHVEVIIYKLITQKILIWFRPMTHYYLSRCWIWLNWYLEQPINTRDENLPKFWRGKWAPIISAPLRTISPHPNWLFFFFLIHVTWMKKSVY